MVPLKRRRVGSSGTSRPGVDGDVKFPDVLLFLLERKMGSSRRDFLSRLGRSKGFQVEESFSESVTHIISENNSGEEVRTWLESRDAGTGGTGDVRRPVHLLDISWYTESMRAGHPVDILDRHRLQGRRRHDAEVAAFSAPSYACQRRTPLQGHNPLLTDCLSTLADSAELSQNEGRGLAFRRAAAVLKSLPRPVTRMEQLRGLPCLGEHSLRVVKDVLENGRSGEVEDTKQSERYRAMKVLTGIFGVGTKTADRWFRDGIHSLTQLQTSGYTLNQTQLAGLDHYDDLNQPVSKAEADAIGQIVERCVLAVLPGAEVTLAGGFRRGKTSGHDVDFLITHPEEGKEEGLVPKVVSWLEAQDFLLYQKTTKNSYRESTDGPGRPTTNMDRFERCFSIFKLARDQRHASQETHFRAACGPEGPAKGNGQTHPQGGIQGPPHPSGQIHLGEPTGPEVSRTWRAVRVDLVVSPISQFPFALLGWTGSKLFERELRRYAGQEKNMTLSSHALFHNTQSRYLRARSEEEIFTHLGLDYIPPSERNA